MPTNLHCCRRKSFYGTLTHPCVDTSLKLRVFSFIKLMRRPKKDKLLAQLAHPKRDRLLTANLFDTEMVDASASVSRLDRAVFDVD